MSKYTETVYANHCKEQVKKVVGEIMELHRVTGYVVVKAFEQVAEPFWHVAASSTGKYHPLYACGEAGLARHTLAAVHFAKRFFKLENTAPYTQAVILAALLLHDTCKCGVQFEERYTVFEHPILVSLLLDVNKLTIEERTTWTNINTLIMSHMGIWNKPTERDIQYNLNRIVLNFQRVGIGYNDIPCLPLPITEEQKFVSRCDYLAADKCCMLDLFESDKAAWKDIVR